MQKYRKFLVLLALSATALAVSGCGASESTAAKTADASATSMQADQEPSDMIFLDNTMYYEQPADKNLPAMKKPVLTVRELPTAFWPMAQPLS